MLSRDRVNGEGNRVSMRLWEQDSMDRRLDNRKFCMFSNEVGEAMVIVVPRALSTLPIGRSKIFLKPKLKRILIR